MYIFQVSNLCDLSRNAKLNTHEFLELPITIINLRRISTLPENPPNYNAENHLHKTIA